MPKSLYAERMDLVETQVSGVLRPLGFRKRARTYNRAVGDGLVHVVNLQMGSYELAEPVPGLREDLHGLFTVNLGVYVPELDPNPGDRPRKNVPEYLCAIRARFGQLTGAQRDLWWPLGDAWPDSAADVVHCLDDHGLPFLNEFRSEDDIIEKWIATAARLRLSNVAKVDIARLLVARGDRATATHLLIEQYRETTLVGHLRYLERLAAQLHLSLGVGDESSGPRGEAL